MTTVTMIGAGQVASHLVPALWGSGIRVAYVFSRHQEHARLLADQVEAEAIDDIRLIADPGELILLAVPDHALPEVIDQLDDHLGGGVAWAHTSGGTTMSVFPPGKSDVGVFYPLQTFTREAPLDIQEIPF